MTSAGSSREPARIALFGLFGVGNIGNEASLASAIAALRRHRHRVDVTVVCAHPDVVSAEHGVPAASFSMAGPFDRVITAPRPVRLALRPITELARWVAALRFARSVDAIIVPGTGILDDFGVAPHQMPYELFRWSTAARLTRRPWAMVGVGAGPIDHPVSRWLMRRTVRNCTIITYRDEVSRSFMAGIGEPSPAISVQPDVAFALPRPDGDHRGAGTPLHVGLGLMAYYGWSNDAAEGEEIFVRYIAEMAKIGAEILGRGDTLRLLVGEQSDEAAVSALITALEQERGSSVADLVTVEPIATFADLLLQVGHTDAVIATRYHNVIAGLMMSRPTVSIGYAQKFRAVMTDYGLGGYCHDVEQVDATSVIADLDAVLGRSDEITSELAKSNQRYSQAVETRFCEVFDVVLGAGTRRAT